MKVEIWSDVVCPFCYLGKHRFEAGLEQFAHKEQVEVIYHSFQLDPYAEKDSSVDLYDALAAKYGTSREQAKSMHRSIVDQGKEIGLVYNFDTAIRTNTLDAHRLIHFAAEYGKRTEVVERLFQAYFTDSCHIGEHATLAEIAAEAGLNREETLAMLTSNRYIEEVRAEQQEANHIGVRGVPFYVFNRKYAVSGAQSSDTFFRTLQKVWEEGQPLIPITPATDDSDDANGQYCADGECKIN